MCYASNSPQAAMLPYIAAVANGKTDLAAKYYRPSGPPDQSPAPAAAPPVQVSPSPAAAPTGGITKSWLRVPTATAGSQVSSKVLLGG